MGLTLTHRYDGATVEPEGVVAPTVDRASPTGSTSSSVLLAAACSLAAGALHVAAGQTHVEHLGLSRLFLAVGAAQLVAGAALLVRPGRGVRAVAGAVNLAVLGAWAITRVAGIEWIGGLEQAEAPQLADALTAALAALAVLALGVGAVRERSSTGSPHRTHPASGGVTALTAVSVTAVALFGLTQVGAHQHGPGHDEVAAGENPAETGDAWRMGATDEERADAERLIADTQAAVAKFASVEDAESRGYVRINDGHLLSLAAMADDRQLDPTAIESLVIANRDGRDVIVGGMYLMNLRQTMKDVPRIGGPLMVWHTHGGFCFQLNGVIAGGPEAKGNCPDGSTFLDDPPMLHIYTEPQADDGVVRTSAGCGTFVYTDLPHDRVVPGCGPNDHANHQH
jgi:hypothetical protein